MDSKRLAAAAPCPCGSGKAYGHCCWNKGFEWREDDDGGIFRSVPISDELGEALAALGGEPPESSPESSPESLPREARGATGRGPFEGLPHPEHIEAQVVEAMKKANIDPALIHAYERTGLLVTEDNQHLIPDIDLERWCRAVREYNAEHGDP